MTTLVTGGNIAAIRPTANTRHPRRTHIQNRYHKAAIPLIILGALIVALATYLTYIITLGPAPTITATTYQQADHDVRGILLTCPLMLTGTLIASIGSLIHVKQLNNTRAEYLMMVVVLPSMMLFVLVTTIAGHITNIPENTWLNQHGLTADALPTTNEQTYSGDFTHTTTNGQTITIHYTQQGNGYTITLPTTGKN